MDFEALYEEGMGLDVEAFWGAGFLADRYRPGSVSWDWVAELRPLLDDADRLLDLGTGDGGVLAGLAPLPPVTVAVEEWPPTVPAAIATLRPLAIHLVQALGSIENAGAPSVARAPLVRKVSGCGSDTPAPDGSARQFPEWEGTDVPHRGRAVASRRFLPFADRAFDLVIDRHAAFDPIEVRRIIRPGGSFVTQQVGSDEASSVRALFDLPTDQPRWDLGVAVGQLDATGWSITDTREERTLSEFNDIAALIGYIRSTPWAFADLDLERALPRLQQLHDQSRVRPIPAITHRFLISARA